MAAVPGYIFIHSVITNDTAVILFVTLSLWIAVRIVREGPSMRLALAGSLFAGLATLSKLNGAWAIGIVGLALLASACLYRHERAVISHLWAIVSSVALWFLITGWWFVFGMLQGGDPLGIAIHARSSGQSLRM